MSELNKIFFFYAEFHNKMEEMNQQNTNVKLFTPKKATKNNFPCCERIYGFLTSGDDAEEGEPQSDCHTVTPGQMQTLGLLGKPSKRNAQNGLIGTA